MFTSNRATHIQKDYKRRKWGRLIQFEMFFLQKKSYNFQAGSHTKDGRLEDLLRLFTALIEIQMFFYID